MDISKTNFITAREAAFTVLRQIEEEAAYANLAWAAFLRRHAVEPRERMLATEIIYGSVRMRLALDHMLAQFLSKSIEELMPEARTILRLSLYQLHFMGGGKPYAVVDQAVELAKKHANPPLARLVNAVLRNYLRREGKNLLPDERDLRQYLHISESYPLWLVDYLLEHYGAKQAKSFCRSGNEHSGIYLRANTLKASAVELMQLLDSEGYTARISGPAPETLILERGLGLMENRLFKEGYFMVQGAASQLAAHALSPQLRSNVIDLCAAPGGKATHMAALMENSGELHAFDIHEHKLRLIADNSRRLGLDIVKPVLGDGAALPSEYTEWADYLLLDAPCSGLGVLASRPDLRWHKQATDIKKLADVSLALLVKAASYVKPGGYLCYTTCTITEEENGGNISRFLQASKGFTLAPMEKLASVLEESDYKKAALSGQVQLFPGPVVKEGFFLALLQKEARA